VQNSILLYLFSVALCGGVALGFCVPALATPLAGLCVFAGILSILFSYTRNRALLLGGVVLVSLSLGLLRTSVALQQEAGDGLRAYHDQEVVMVGRVLNDPDRRDASLHVELAVVRVYDAPVQGKVLLFVPRDEKVAYNDQIVVRGALTRPQSFTTDTGHTFDYANYLRAKGISSVVYRAQVDTVDPGGWTVLGQLYDIKHLFERSLERQYPEPDASLMAGMLLGEKHGMPEEVTDDFVQSGLIHVVVLSGYNISIVSESIFRLLSFLPQTLRIGLGGTCMILFALMAGAGAATMRALLMGLIALMARYLHRPAAALRALALAATGMVLVQPQLLLYDPGFILSVLATFGLVTLSTWVEVGLGRWRLFRRAPENIRSIAASTIAVQIYILPALLYFSGTLSFLSVPANVLALPVVPAAMLLGFVAGVFGLVSPLISTVPALASDLLLKWMLIIAHTTASVPLGAVTTGEFSPLVLVAVYIPLTWFALKKCSQNETPPRSN